MEPIKTVSFLDPDPRRRSGTLLAPASPKKEKSDPKARLPRANSFKHFPTDNRGSYSIGLKNWAQHVATDKRLQREIKQLIFRRKATTDLNVLELLAFLGSASPNVSVLYTTYLAISEEEATLTPTPKGAYSLVGREGFCEAVKKVKLWLSSKSKEQPPLEPLIKVVASYMESYLKTREPAKPPPRKSSAWQLFSKPAVQSIDEVPFSILHLTDHYCYLTTALPNDLGEYVRVKGEQIVDALPMHLSLICAIMDKLYTAQENEKKLPPTKQNTAYLLALKRWLVEVLQPEKWKELTKEKGPVPNKVVGSGLIRSLMQLNERWNRVTLAEQARAQVLTWMQRQRPLQQLLILGQHLEWDVDLTLIATDPSKGKLLRGIAESGVNFKKVVVNGETLPMSTLPKEPIEIATEIGKLIIKHCWPHEEAQLDVQAMEKILQHPEKCSPLEMSLRMIFLGLEIGSHAQHQNQFRKHCLALHEPPLTAEKDKDNLGSTTILTVIPDRGAETVTASITREFVIYRRAGTQPLARYERETYLTLAASGQFTRAGLRIKTFDWESDVTLKERELITHSFMGLKPPSNCNN